MFDEKMIATADHSHLLASLERNEAALWLELGGLSEKERIDLLPFIILPWKLVLIEGGGQKLTETLRNANAVNGALVRRRGFIHVFDSDPSRVELPPKRLPIYLLNSSDKIETTSSFGSRLRRLTMLEELRRSGARKLVVLSPQGVMPVDLTELWKDGFRALLTIISNVPESEAMARAWLVSLDPAPATSITVGSITDVTRDIADRFSTEYPEDRTVIRLRDNEGGTSTLDVSELDDPERPVLGHYNLIRDRDLSTILASDLTETEITGFFRDSTSSWKPYAAGLPWMRDGKAGRRVRALLAKLDANGARESVVAYISSQSGAGGTTLARNFAWFCAREGYPTLVASQLPFEPTALPLVNFLNRVHLESIAQRPDAARVDSRKHEAPWVIVFDVVHWRSRESEIIGFRNEIARSGRPVLILVVIGPIMPIAFYDTSKFVQIAELGHEISESEARELGTHINRYLGLYGRQRRDSDWERFYRDHSVRLIEGAAAFWLSLSFWIRGQYDLSESIQEWMYRCFKLSVSQDLMQTILQIAALSSERVPMPEGMLPPSSGKWPVSYLLEDMRSELAPLGLTSIKSDGLKYWALLHDVLGRFLINALFYDHALKSELGFENSTSPEHLRFNILRQVSKNPILGEVGFRAVGEEFATSLFKVDPDHGRGSFAPYWKEVLSALAEMPRSLRDSSRVFRHHVAVSRRRIAKMNGSLYNISLTDRISLLRDAVEDLQYAIDRIAYRPGSESDLNLYNSLANAYLDLASSEAEADAPEVRVAELRELANVATRRAFNESPTNSFVVETHVKNLLENAKSQSSIAVQNSIEILGIVFGVLATDGMSYRRGQLNDFANQALVLLLNSAPPTSGLRGANSAVDVLVSAWREIAVDGVRDRGLDFTDISAESVSRALAVLEDPAGRGNLQVIELAYHLTVREIQNSFARQLELIEQIVNSQSRPSPQLRLEYAILLFQCGRALEGEKQFRELRKLWKEGDYFVQVPDRLRWLFTKGTGTPQVVNAVTASDRSLRSMARVREFANSDVPFRAEEFGSRDSRPGQHISCLVSFGSNGPFLRPVTAFVSRD